MLEQIKINLTNSQKALLHIVENAPKIDSSLLNMGILAYIKEFKYFSFNLPRRWGKSTFIENLKTRNTIVIKRAADIPNRLNLIGIHGETYPCGCNNYVDKMYIDEHQLTDEDWKALLGVAEILYINGRLSRDFHILWLGTSYA